jgi:hypothetical protein
MTGANSSLESLVPHPFCHLLRCIWNFGRTRRRNSTCRLWNCLTVTLCASWRAASSLGSHSY